MPEEKQQQCLVYASITHLHFKSGMFATSEILLFPSSNSGLPLRKVAGKEVGEKKQPKQTSHVDILARSSWQSLPPNPLPMMQNQSFAVLFRRLARLCIPPPVPAGCLKRLMGCMEGTASGHLKRATCTPLLPQKHGLSHPAFPPPPRLTCHFRYPPGRITFPQRKTHLVLLSFLQNTMHGEELHPLPPGRGRAMPRASCSRCAGPWVLPASLVITKCQPRAGKHRLHS